MGTGKNRYSQLIEAIFNQYYENGKEAIQFERTDLVTQAKALNIKLPKNLGDILYSFRYRTPLPESITSKAHFHLLIQRLKTLPSINGYNGHP